MAVVPGTPGSLTLTYLTCMHLEGGVEREEDCTYKVPVLAWAVSLETS